MASTRRSAESPKKTDMKEHSMKEEQEHIGSERIKGSRGGTGCNKTQNDP